MQTETKTYDDTWLVIPLYNEEKMIGKVVSESRKRFHNIVCIDDGSSDASAEKAAEAGAIVIKHPFNLGQGAALQTGINFAITQPETKYIVTFDADGQHRLSDAMAMVDRAERDDLAIIFGSRFLDGSTQIGWAKHLVLKTAAVVTRWRTGLDLTDAHNGLRLLRIDAAKKIYLSQDRMAHASEIVGELARTKLPWAEMPVTIDYTAYSKGKGQSLLNSVNILIDLIMR